MPDATELDLESLHLDTGAHSDPNDGHCLSHGNRTVRIKRGDVERFSARLSAAQGDSGCLIWTGGTMHRGYGIFHVAGVAIRSHRFAYQIANGPIPDGMVLDHLCRNRLCVRVDHLEPVTPRENVMRSPIAPAQINTTKTECPAGHPYSGSNVRFRPSGARYCGECSRQRCARYTRKVAAR